MRAAVLHDHGTPPRCEEFDDPRPSDDTAVVEVEAAGLSHLDVAKASGTFYTGPPPLPSVAGSDGVGRLPDGRRVFFDTVVPPYGSLAERVLVPSRALFDVAEGIDSKMAAALGNSGLAAWLALEWRARLRPGETVLVLGATGAMGTAAVQIARALGAGRVVAAARPSERLRRLDADAVVELDGEDGTDGPGRDLAAAMREAAGGGADVVIDPLWGPPALAAMGAARHGARHIQLGQQAAMRIDLPAPLVRSAALDIRGFAIFHAPIEVRRDAYLRMTRLAASGGLKLDLEVIPLADITGAWERQRCGPGTKLVVACH
ncbi:zinc-binding alcohol dehydrogenase family protein [Nonomuraea sp. NPDC049309]|uniref:quinone oxidoreductase family protein n=1 Tax=Nonomuraea sp. NPDC049309 TaxID=3364350 RepID=UPI0037176164